MAIHKLIFNTEDFETIADSANVGAYIRSSESGALITNHSLFKAAGGTFNFADGDVTIGTENINSTAHGFVTGDLIQLTSTGTLPAGLSTATDYYVIRVDDDNIKLAASAKDAEEGTAVDITAAAGGGTHTVTGFVQDSRHLDVYSATADGEGNPITSTGGGLDVNILSGSININTSHLNDSMRLGDGTSFFTSTSENGDISLDVHISNSNIEVTQGTTPWVIGDGGGSITVDAVDLDIRDLAFATDSVTSHQGGTWTVGLSEDHNYGAVGANTLRTAAQIGNATGAADFNTGATTAQTLRVTMATDSSIEVTDAALANTAIASAANILGAANVAEDVVVSPLADRKYLYLYNQGNREAYIGQSGVSAATGFPMPPGSLLELRAGAAVDIEWVSSNTSQELRTLELS